jgi:hypothetical protein
MKNQPDIYGMDSTKPVVYFVGPTYCATASSVIQTPDRHQYLFLLIVFPHRPVESGEPCLFVCSEVAAGSGQHVLGILDEAGHQILQNEDGDWTDFDSFKRRAVEIASERFHANFAERPPGKWDLKTVSSASDETLSGLVAEGWETACPNDILDGKEWLLFKRPKSAAPVSV